MELFLQIILVIIISSITSFLFSYLKEKGKNRAYLGDVEKITQKIETIKGDISKELSLFNNVFSNSANVSHLTHKKD